MSAVLPEFAVIALQAAGGGAGTGLQELLLLFGPIFFIMYFLVIRPQSKKQKEQVALLKAIDKGDRVVTAGGLHGQVTGVTDDVLTLEIANVKGERVRIKVDRDRIERRLERGKGEDS